MRNNNQMYRQAGHPAAPKKYTLLNVLIILLSVILAISILVTVHAFREASPVYYDTDSSLYYHLKDGSYESLDRRYYENAIGRENDPKVQQVSEYYAVGRYFEKAFFAKAFETAGDSKKAARYRTEMDRLEKEMGDFSAEKQLILKLLEMDGQPSVQ